jgi:hypothetical protein
VSQEFHLVTRERPAGEGFRDALREAIGDDAAAPPDVEGDFGDPNAYLNVSAPQLWLEIEPPGHVEAADLAGDYAADLPDPDDDQCLWLTVANVPAGAPDGSAAIARRALESLAARYDGVAVEPAL